MHHFYDKFYEKKNCWIYEPHMFYLVLRKFRYLFDLTKHHCIVTRKKTILFKH